MCWPSDNGGGSQTRKRRTTCDERAAERECQRIACASASLSAPAKYVGLALTRSRRLGGVLTAGYVAAQP